MRRAQLGIGILCTVLTALAGCYSTHHIAVVPPVHEEQYNLPPEGDKRYCSAPQFPKGTLNQPKKKDDWDANKGVGPSSGSNGMAGMGGMGGMGRMGMQR